jgi:hypothetical protein
VPTNKELSLIGLGWFRRSFLNSFASVIIVLHINFCPSSFSIFAKACVSQYYVVVVVVVSSSASEVSILPTKRKKKEKKKKKTQRQKKTQRNLLDVTSFSLTLIFLYRSF